MIAASNMWPARMCPANHGIFLILKEEKKVTLQRGMVGEEYQRIIEPDIEALRKTLEELGIAENTLIVAMSDNGPMTHNPPPGAGRGEGLFRGGKGRLHRGRRARRCRCAVAGSDRTGSGRRRHDP